jgi:FkbM family methyltransferase
MKLTDQGIAIIEGDNYLSADIIAQGRLDVAREALLPYKQYIPEGGVVLDIGACLGDYTATFSEFVGPEGTVHAFEPNPLVYECLEYNMRSYPNVHCHTAALGAEDKAVGMVQDHNNIGASYVQPGSGMRMMPLDRVALYWGRIDFIKIDAEGCEPWVLEGAMHVLQLRKPVLLVEIDQRALSFQGFKPEDVHAQLDALSYTFERYSGTHGNILCVPR